MENKKPPGPPDPPSCMHGKVINPMRRNCQECIDEDIEIKKLVNPLIDEYWESRGKQSLYHIVFRAYHMGMRHD